jgi:hypothetical protein
MDREQISVQVYNKTVKLFKKKSFDICWNLFILYKNSCEYLLIYILFNLKKKRNMELTRTPCVIRGLFAKQHEDDGQNTTSS